MLKIIQRQVVSEMTGEILTEITMFCLLSVIVNMIMFSSCQESDQCVGFIYWGLLCQLKEWRIDGSSIKNNMWVARCVMC